MNSVSLCKQDVCLSYSGDAAKLIAAIFTITILVYSVSKLVEDSNVLINNLNSLKS